ncbi:hypothetical protein DKX38_025769 [Salix brachista]|uniref:Uncharacterized protein n=1 Tax=Salix brachista TaxID=2182728 RepID=A0A5N5JV75_9ROSI|nr:hypothetical protein DKX38_025769 [Salix brachista]
MLFYRPDNLLVTVEIEAVPNVIREGDANDEPGLLLPWGHEVSVPWIPCEAHEPVIVTSEPWNPPKGHEPFVAAIKPWSPREAHYGGATASMRMELRNSCKATHSAETNN